jgi:hypothetical protein
MEVPHICAGEDLMMITGISHILRMSGAFFMRRTFRGDPLYKAIFITYVQQLVSDKVIMEFFVEGNVFANNFIIYNVLLLRGLFTSLKSESVDGYKCLRKFFVLQVFENVSDISKKLILNISWVKKLFLSKNQIGENLTSFKN